MDQPAADRDGGLENVLGGKVTATASLPGGFSEGVAARLELSDGRRAFAKAADVTAAPAEGATHRREGVVASRLPSGAPAPRLLGIHDDGEWVALVFEQAAGDSPSSRGARTNLHAYSAP
ncbi:hypothetical protein [Streptomyces abyssalis]|uniref:hypothetical protein n=1 Tax=Streptomyces abyssalis TaxID=933944 RepID=UPI00085CA8E8|nr:hypothetical protein [Streptomyces abyssalis]